MSLLTDLTIRGQYGAAAAAQSSTAAAVSDSGSFSEVLSAAYQSGTSYESFFQMAADTFQVPVDLIKAVAKAESDFNANAVSHCGAQGIMQLMPATARSLGVTNSFDPAQNIMGGTKYLRQMLDCFDGNVSKAVAAYNAGPNAVKKYGGVPPYRETQNYVTKVLGYAGSGVSVPTVPVSAPAVSADPADSGETAAASSQSVNSLTRDELVDLFFQMYRSGGVDSRESAYLLMQQILLRNEKENDEEDMRRL